MKQILANRPIWGSLLLLCSLPTTTGYVMTDSNIRTAVSLWRSDRTAAIQKYGHISAWDTSRVTDMGYLFYPQPCCPSLTWPEFNEDISAWDTSSATTFTYMFYYASSFNQPIGRWSVDKLTSMTDMFRGAEAFNQDLGWCLGDHVKLAEKETFKKTKCESTRCGVAQKDEFGTCDPGTRAGYITLIVLLLLLAGAGAYVRQRKKEDETYVAAARRLLCCLCYRNETDSNSVTSSQPASPAESPPDQPKFTRSRSGLGWVYTESGTQKRCKHCGQARSRNMFIGKQWKKPRPTCVDCASRLSAQNATAEKTSSISTAVIAEAEEAPTEQPPPPPPARRWFSRAEPEPAAPKFEEMYNQIAAWYKKPGNAALRARWGPFPDPDEFQTWPGFVRVTNAFLDATVLDGEAVTSPGNVVVDAEPVSPGISFWGQFH